jgi:hypothetical protein
LGNSPASGCFSSPKSPDLSAAHPASYSTGTGGGGISPEVICPRREASPHPISADYNEWTYASKPLPRLILSLETSSRNSNTSICFRHSVLQTGTATCLLINHLNPSG